MRQLALVLRRHHAAERRRRAPPAGANATPYFIAVPVAKNDVPYDGATTKGIFVPSGGSVTVDVQLLSDGPTSAWTVHADSQTTGWFDYKLDKTTGADGDVLKLTISDLMTANTSDVLSVTSTSGNTRHSYVVPVVRR